MALTQSVFRGVNRRTSGGLAALALAGCATSVAVTDEMPKGPLSDGEGIVIGSIVMTTPKEVTDPDQKEMVDSLRSRRLTATIRRYQEGDPSSWSGSGRKWVGDPYVIAFDVDAEKRFVLRAPVGTYSIVKLAAIRHGLFGDEEGCTMADVATFAIHAGMTSYVGRLEVRAGFHPNVSLKRERAVENAERRLPSTTPEKYLVMSLTATDAKEATLRGLFTDPSRAPAGVETLVMTPGIANWYFEEPPPPPPPVPPAGR